MLTIADGRPEVLGLRDIIRYNVEFQYEINTRKYTTLLKKEYDNKEIKEGLIKACNIIDLIIEILRGSTNLKQAKTALFQAIPRESDLSLTSPKKMLKTSFHGETGNGNS